MEKEEMYDLITNKISKKRSRSFLSARLEKGAYVEQKLAPKQRLNKVNIQ
jgi:hypothetical protein